VTIFSGFAVPHKASQSPLSNGNNPPSSLVSSGSSIWQRILTVRETFRSGRIQRFSRIAASHQSAAYRCVSRRARFCSIRYSMIPNDVRLSGRCTRASRLRKAAIKTDGDIYYSFSRTRKLHIFTISRQRESSHHSVLLETDPLASGESIKNAY